MTSVDPRGKVTSTTYDDNLTDGIGFEAKYPTLMANLSFGPGADGSASVTTDPLGEVSITINDPLGRGLRKADGNLNATTTTYDVVFGGLLERSVTDALGHTTRTRGDGAQLDRQSVDATGNVSTAAYDADGNRLQRRDANGTGEDCTYDALNRRTVCTDTNNNTNATTYDVEGNKLTTTDGLGKVTACSYDARNRKRACTDRNGGVQAYAYDADSNLVQLTDADGGVTGYQYDPRELQTKITYPGGSVRQFAYDPARRLVSLIQQDGSTTTYSYDTANRLLARHYPDGKDDTFGYDDANRLTQANSARYQTSVARGYDAASRITSDGQTVFGATHTVSYAYDPANRLTTLTYPDGSTIGRQYTSRNQLSRVSGGAATVASFTYDAGERLITTQLGNGLSESRTYGTDNLLASTVTPGIADFEYAYDHNKRKRTEGNGVTPGESQTFAYDNEDRVVTWSKQAGDAQTWQLTLANDWRSTVRNGVSETRTHDSAHETLTVNGTVLTYDLRGNLTRNSRGDAYAWDVDNQLKTATVGGKQASYVYDPLGRRLGKTSSGVSVTLVNDDENVVAEYNGATLLRTYIYSDYADHAVALKSNGATYYFTANSLYSVAAVTNSAGALVERYTYDAYGKRTVTLATGSQSSASVVGNPYGFTGRYHDDETALVYFRTRYYDPALGRFITRDKTYRDGPNLYAAYFVPNHLDPSGQGFKAGIKGEADLQLSFCDGGNLDALLKGWAGVGYDYHGLFVGIQWEGELKSNIKKDLFGDTFNCGENCAWCCEDPYAIGGFTSTPTGAFGALLAPITKALKSAGVECDVETKITACVKGLGLDCKANLIETAFPELVPILEAIKEAGVEVEAGFHLELDFEFCKSAESNWALKEANFLGGAYIEVGYGL